LGGVDQVSLRDEQSISIANLPARLRSRVELLRGVLGVNQRHDSIQPIALRHVQVEKERLGYWPRICQTCGLHDQIIERDLPCATSFRQVRECGSQVITNTATHAAIAELHDVFVATGYNDLAVNVLFAELILDDGDPEAVRLGEYAAQQGGL